MPKFNGPWKIYICPTCGGQVDLRLKQPKDVKCYGVAGNHKATPVEEVEVIRKSYTSGDLTKKSRVSQLQHLITDLATELTLARRRTAQGENHRSIKNIESDLKEAQKRLDELVLVGDGRSVKGMIDR